MTPDLTDPDVQVTLIAAVGGVVTALLAFITAPIANHITRRMKDRELFQSALQHLNGKTQSRSVGIAIVKRYAEEKDMRDVASTIFLAQMLHLRDEGYGSATPGERKIEEFNFQVMQDAVKGWETPKIGDKAKAVAIGAGISLT